MKWNGGMMEWWNDDDPTRPAAAGLELTVAVEISETRIATQAAANRGFSGSVRFVCVSSISWFSK